MNSRPSLTLGELFAGIGGIGAGLALVGVGPVLWQCEKEPFCRAILRKHYPTAAHVADVHDVHSGSVERVDVIAGGFPCQPVSLAGKRLAQQDARWLWPQFARVLGDLRPSFAFLENVPGLLTADHGRAFAEVVGDLASLGFDAEWDLFRASDVGAPHKRERLFVLAYAKGGIRLGPTPGATGYAPLCDQGASGELAYAGRIGQREPHHAEGTVSCEWDARQSACGGSGTLRASERGEVGVDQVNPDGERGQQRDVRPFAEGSEVTGPTGGIGSLGVGAAESGVGRDPDGPHPRLDRTPRWPAGRGEAQHAHEPPRVAHGVPHRPARLKALGNAVVPQVAALAWSVLYPRLMGGAA